MFGLSKARRDAEFTDFVRGQDQTLLRMALALTGDAHAARELVQATLVKTYVAWGRIRPGEATAYTRRIIVNQRIDTWRATRHETARDIVPEHATGPGTDLVDARDDLVRLLATLPEQQRKVVVLRYYADQSEAQVADLLGISVGAVKSAASRGLAAVHIPPIDRTTGTPASSSQQTSPEVAVTWYPTPMANGRNLTYSTVNASGELETLGGSSTVGLAPNVITWDTASNPMTMIVGVMPASAEEFTAITPKEMSVGRQSRLVPIPGSDLLAFAIAFDTPVNQRDLDIMWLDKLRVVRDQQGVVVPSLTVSGAALATCYLRESESRYGCFLAGGGVFGQLPSKADAKASGGGYVLASGQQGDRMVGRAIAFVESGSTSAAVTGDGASVTSDASVHNIPGTSWALLSAVVTEPLSVAPSSANRSEVAMSWTGPDGVRRTTSDKATK